MSWWASLQQQEKTTIHDCPNCGGHVEPAEEVFTVSITYNVGRMLRRAGIHPQVLNGMKVSEAQGIVTNAVCLMEDNPAYFKTFNAANGLGTYETTLEAVVSLAEAMHEGNDDDVLRWA